MASSFLSAQDPAESLAILKKVIQQQRQPNLDPMIAAQLDRQDRLDEIKRNLAKRGPGFATGATPEDAAQLEGDINEDPTLGIKAQQEQALKDKTYQEGVAYEQPEALKMRNEAQNEKLSLATAPEAMRQSGAANVEAVKSRGALDLLRQKQAGESELAKMFGQGNESGNTTMTLGPNGPTFHQKGISGPEQTTSEAANDILNLLKSSDYENQARNLHEKGLFSPGIGIARRFLAQHGLGSVAGVDEETAKQMGRFETTHDLLLSALARAQGGARTAGSATMAQRFDKVLSSQGDLPTFLGQLEGIKTMLAQTAARTHPQSIQPTSDEDLGPGWGQ